MTGGPVSHLQTQILNKHLNEQMEGLTAKVFRTFNASRTLQEQLDQLTEEDMTVNEKVGGGEFRHVLWSS